MKIEYLGTGAAEGFPAMFCNCEHCRRARTDLQREMRTRSQAIVDGELLIDFPPESYLHAMRGGLDFSAVRYLLVTHSHTDHFYAQELCNRGYRFAYKMAADALDIYGNEEVRSVFEEGIRREVRPAVREGLRFHTVHAFADFKAGEYRVLTLPARHGNKEEALLYCVQKKDKTFLWLNDSGPLYDEIYPFLAEKGIVADLVSFDCTFADEKEPSSERHMNIFQNMQARDKMVEYRLVKADTKYYVTHFSHNGAPFREEMERMAERYGFIAAHDGSVAEI